MRAAQKREELAETFNKVSKKIICVQEYNQKEKAIMKQKMTFGEKAFSIVDSLHQVFNMIVTFPKFYKEAQQMTLYLDPVAEDPLALQYVSAKELLETEVSVYSEGLNKTFQEKILKCRVQALEECVDHSARVKSGELKLQE